MAESKSALAKMLERAASRVDREKDRFDSLQDTMGRTIGAAVTGPSTAGLVGYLETRFPNKDGSLLSLGPISLPVLFGVPALVGSIVPWAGARQLSYVAASQFGLASGTIGRAYGAAAKLKSDAKKLKGGGIGEEEEDDDDVELETGWSDAERALLGE